MQSLEDYEKSLELLHSKKKTDKESLHFDSVVNEVFNTPKGHELIKLFRKYILDTPVSPLSKPPRYADFREGMNWFIRTSIVGALERYKDRENNK